MCISFIEREVDASRLLFISIERLRNLNLFTIFARFIYKYIKLQLWNI